MRRILKTGIFQMLMIMSSGVIIYLQIDNIIKVILLRVVNLCIFFLYDYMWDRLRKEEL